MAAEDFQGLRVYSANPAPTATVDVQVAIIDSTGTRTLAIDSSNRAEVSLFANGTGLTVNGSNLNINIAQQSATALAVSRDGAANSVTHGLYANLLQGDAALSATNGLHSNLLQGNAALSAANPIFASLAVGGAVKGATGSPIFTELNQGAAALSATNGLYANLLQGNAALSVTHGLYTNLLNGDAILSASNFLSMRPTNGTAYNSVAAPLFAELSTSGSAVSSGNPLPVTFAAVSTGADIYPFHQSAAVVAQGATDTHTYTPSGALTGYIRRIAVQAAGYAHFVVKRGATTLFKFSTSPSEPMQFLPFPEGDPLQVNNAVNLTIDATNDGKDSILLTSWLVGSEQ